MKRFVSIWFRMLKTDWFIRRQPALAAVPFILRVSDHGRAIVSAASQPALDRGIMAGMSVADARALAHSLQVFDDDPLLAAKLLLAIAEWCIRFTPAVVTDEPDGLLLDASGCAHLWGGEEAYLNNIYTVFTRLGYQVHIAMADTAGAAWAMARYGKNHTIVPPGQQRQALLDCSPEALRIDASIIERLYKLGLKKIKHFISMPSHALSRRFGPSLLLRLGQALGTEEEIRTAVELSSIYQERLPVLEPVTSLKGLELSLEHLLHKLCSRLSGEGKGLRSATLTGFCTDHRTEKITISTNYPSHDVTHLYKLFSLRFPFFRLEPGVELFMLEALKVEPAVVRQEKLWETSKGLTDKNLADLLDRIQARFGEDHIARYLPDEHYWPERSVRKAFTLAETSFTAWNAGRPRPIRLLAVPEKIEVTAPIPDYPPMLFRYKGRLHKIARADGPERIEQEWWIQSGEHRDYYQVEDEAGCRYWLFRLGHYTGQKTEGWYIHGFFA